MRSLFEISRHLTLYRDGFDFIDEMLNKSRVSLAECHLFTVSFTLNECVSIFQLKNKLSQFIHYDAEAPTQKHQNCDESKMKTTILGCLRNRIRNEEIRIKNQM